MKLALTSSMSLKVGTISSATEKLHELSPELLFNLFLTMTWTSFGHGMACLVVDLLSKS